MNRIEKGKEILARGRDVLVEGRKAIERLDKTPRQDCIRSRQQDKCRMQLRTVD